MDALHRLAEASGIGLRYHDIWGTQHDVPEGTLRTLLATMGFDASSDVAAQSALDGQVAATWRRRVEPMVVVRHDAQPIRVRLHLPATIRTDVVDVRVAPESGRERNERVSLSPVLDHATIDGALWHS